MANHKIYWNNIKTDKEISISLKNNKFINICKYSFIYIYICIYMYTYTKLKKKKYYYQDFFFKGSIQDYLDRDSYNYF